MYVFYYLLGFGGCPRLLATEHLGRFSWVFEFASLDAFADRAVYGVWEILFFAVLLLVG